MVGFIFMIDEFRPENGATRFLPGSQGASEAPGTLDDAGLWPGGFDDYLQRFRVA